MTTMANDQSARENWARWQYGKDRGHIEYTEQAALCERMYMGGGLQWSDTDKDILRGQGRPFYEFNEVKPSVNSAIGYQIQNRMDIAFKPRGEKGDLETATILSKVAMQVADATKLHWMETQVYSDGLIEQRGYYDVRMDFDRNMKGDITIFGLDPRDVIPDPDAKSYDPDKWGDVTVSRWLTLDEIEQLWGKAARDKAEASGDDGQDYGDTDDEERRNKFGSDRNVGLYDAFNMGADNLKRYRVIDRQISEYVKTDCLVFPETGDILILDSMAADSIADALSKGAVRAKRMRRRIRWVVSTYSTTLHEGYSPYDHFTIVPYFAYFRRGMTRGMVDDAIGPQEALNKAVSQYVHIINTSANSGWVVEEDSLTNMDTEELEDIGAKTGLVIEYKAGSTKPEKITPNQIPTGVDKLIDRATKALKDVTVPEAMRGQQGPESSGVAIQAKQFASQQQLAVPLDNLAYTRQMLATRILKLIQRYYDSYRVFRITETDPQTGKPREEILEINKFDPETGSYLYDVTVGEYDVVITEQPMQVTFENSQFQQVIELMKAGVQLPPTAALRYSNLSDKHDLIEQISSAGAPPPDPEAEANAQLTLAQARKADSDATNTDMETLYSAAQTAQVLATIPQTAPLADELAASVGFKDQNGGTAVPQLAEAAMATPPVDPFPSNTDPTTPASPDVGFRAGIETPEADGVIA